MTCRFATATGVLLAGALAVSADFVMTTKHHTDAYQVMGQSVPASDRTTTTWISTSAARMDQSADTSMIFDFATNTIRLLRHSSKTYTELQIPDLQKAMSEAMKADGATAEEQAAAAQMMQSMMGAMKLTVSVTPTSESKKVGSWDCKKYIVKTQVSVSTSESEIWATTGITIDAGLYQRVLNSKLLQMPGAADAVKEWTKIKGVPVLTTTKATVMGASVVSTDEVISAEQKTPPSGTYSVPSGYKPKKQ